MRISRFGRLGAAAAIVAAAMAPMAAHANINAALLNVVPSAGGFTYNYQIQLEPGFTLNPNQSFTIFDFNGFTGVLNYTPAAFANFTTFTDFVGDNTPANQEGPIVGTDNPAALNVGITSTGVINNPTAAQIILGTFSVESEFAQGGTFTAYRGESTNNVNLQPSANGTFVGGPNIGTVVPEPGTVTLIGTALLGMVGVAARRRRAAK